ncbi:MAG: PP2C family protein-serine/threonine phosphatase [Flavobacteriales bacterium]
MIFIYLTYVFLAIGIVLSLFAYLRVKSQLNARNNDFQKQFKLLEESHSEIKASINYAKRIQKAMLPKQTHLEEIFPNYFVLFQPKDVVSGDFYFAEHRNGKVIFAAADCTGHGVPGALMSVLCSNMLSKTIKDMRITHPGEVLDMTTVLIMQRFQDNGTDVKDGMDLVLCSLDEYTLELEYASASMPLIVVRNSEALVYEGNKQSVGLNDFRQSFSSHTIQLQKGDMIYLATDGYADQFGGAQGKKMKSKAFREFLVSIAQEELDVQNKMLEKKFSDWKGSYEQLDDVCIFGVRV